MGRGTARLREGSARARACPHTRALTLPRMAASPCGRPAVLPYHGGLLVGHPVLRAMPSPRTGWPLHRSGDQRAWEYARDRRLQTTGYGLPRWRYAATTDWSCSTMALSRAISAFRLA